MLQSKPKTKSKTVRKTSKSSFLNTPKKKTMFFSAIGGLVIILITIVTSNLSGNTSIEDVGIIGGIIVAVVPPAMLDLKASRKRDSIDRNLPLFLLAVGGSVQSGQTLLKAIEESADRNMGGLTPELRNLRANISWGMPVEEAIENFIQKTNTRMCRRVMILLQLAMQIGGDIIDTLDVIQKHVTEMANLEKERKSSLQPYIFTIYISFAVFLAIAIILVSQFFVQIENVQHSLAKSTKEMAGSGAGAGPGVFSGLLGVKVSDLTRTMFHMAIVESVIGGLAAGKIGEGSFIAGIKHIVMMIIMSVIGFAFVGGL